MSFAGRYFNELDPYAAAWLGNLSPEAAIDDRSIVSVQPGDLVGYRRVHLFAGIGGWEYALSLAGWPEDREVWTGSCPCQPFSGAGRHDGLLDPRHLWPAFHRLIAECRPAIVFGEQVASAAGRAWLAGVRTDLEDLGYAVGAVDLCAASVGAPHIRQRLYWVAESTGPGRGPQPGRDGGADGRPATEPRRLRDAVGLADAEQDGRQGRLDADRGQGATPFGLRSADAGRVGDAASGGRREQWDAPREGRSGHPERPGGAGSLVGGMGDAALGRVGSLDEESSAGDGSTVADRGSGVPRGVGEPDRSGREPGRQGSAAVGYGDAAVSAGRAGRLAEPDGWHSGDGDVQRGREHGQQPENGRVGFWDAYDLLPCRDGKARRVEPGSFPLAHGVPARMGRLRAYGNAIVPQVAAEFVRAYMETAP